LNDLHHECIKHGNREKPTETIFMSGA